MLVGALQRAVRSALNTFDEWRGAKLQERHRRIRAVWDALGEDWIEIAELSRQARFVSAPFGIIRGDGDLLEALEWLFSNDLIEARGIAPPLGGKEKFIPREFRRKPRVGS